MLTLKVYPTKASAVGLKHPDAHPLALAGTQWPRDSFTARRLTDGSVTEEASKVFKPSFAPATERTDEAASDPVASDKPDPEASARS